MSEKILLEVPLYRDETGNLKTPWGDTVYEDSNGYNLLDSAQYTQFEEEVISPYPGWLRRQDLVNFCVGYVTYLETSKQSVENSLTVKTLPEQTKQVLMETIAMFIGEQKALRSVIEWAKAFQTSDKALKEIFEKK